MVVAGAGGDGADAPAQAAAVDLAGPALEAQRLDALVPPNRDVVEHRRSGKKIRKQNILGRLFHSRKINEYIYIASNKGKVIKT